MAGVIGDHSHSDEVKLMTRGQGFKAESAIISLCHANDWVFGGSEDGRLFMWSDSACSQGESPISSLSIDSDNAVNYICYLPKHTLLVGVGATLYFVDIAEASDGVMSPGARIPLADEINEIQINEKMTHAAVADDSGCLTMIDLKTRKLHKRLLGHENICSCVKFRPKSPWSVVTGGLDCMLILWNFKTEKALGNVNMAETAKKEETDKDSYVVNPPLIHCLDISADGLIAAAGLENGKVVLLTIGGKGFKLASTVDAHHQGISNVQIFDDLTMVTSGNDSEIHIWKLSTARAPGKTLVWAAMTHTGNLPDKPSSLCYIDQKKAFLVADETQSVHLLSLESSS